MRDGRRGGITSTQRTRNRRGRGVLGCEVSGRWLRFGDAFDPKFGEGDAVWVDVLTDIEGEGDVGVRTRKLASLMVRVEDLRAILEQIDERI